MTFRHPFLLLPEFILDHPHLPRMLSMAMIYTSMHSAGWGLFQSMEPAKRTWQDNAGDVAALIPGGESGVTLLARVVRSTRHMCLLFYRWHSIHLVEAVNLAV
jgi:hypothetical protein